MAHLLDEKTLTINGEGTLSFDFDLWIKHYQLVDIKQSFVENEMTTFDALSNLSFGNDNFHKLMMNQRVLSHPQLIPNIMKGIEVLQQQKEKEEDHKENHLIFMTEKEHDVLSTTEKYIDEVNKIQNELNNKTKIGIEKKKKQNEDTVKKYVQNNLSVLDKMSADLEGHFAKIFEVLKRKQQQMKDQINEKKTKIIRIQTQYDEMVHVLDECLQNIFEFVTDAQKYYNRSIAECHEIFKQHHDQHNKLNVNSKNDEREFVICAIGRNVKETHSFNDERFANNMEIINKFIKTEMSSDDEKTSLYSLETEVEVYKMLCNEQKALFCIKERDDSVQEMIQSHNENLHKVCNDKEFVIVEDGIRGFTSDEAAKLRVGDKIDFRNSKGLFFVTTIIEKKNSQLKLHYDGWDGKYDKWQDYKEELDRFAKVHSITSRPAHRLTNLEVGDHVDINPMNRGWKSGLVEKLEKCQIKVQYKHENKDAIYWSHADNIKELAAFGTKVK